MNKNFIYCPTMRVCKNKMSDINYFNKFGIYEGYRDAYE